MALKDITLGQYFPGNSLLHRFDPRSKILFTVLFIAAIFLCKGLVSYGITLLILLMMIGISKVQPRVFLKGMKPVVFIVVCTAILNLFYTSGTVLVELGHPQDHRGGHLEGGLHGVTNPDAHRLHPAADLHHLPHPLNGRAGKAACGP